MKNPLVESSIPLALSVLSFLVLSPISAMASGTASAASGQHAAQTTQTRPPQQTLRYEEEGMTLKKSAHLFTSQFGYSMYVYPDYRHSVVGAYDVFTMKGNPHAWFSIGRLNAKDNFVQLSIPVKQSLSKLGQVSVSQTNNTLELMAVNLQKHVSEEYVFTHRNGKAFRFHIVHESDWESNAPFFAMFKTIQ